MKAFGVEGVTIQQFNESAGGQIVFHLHVHVIPRRAGVPLKPPASEKERPEVLAEQAGIAKLQASLRGKPDDATYYDRIRLGELIAQAVTAKRDGDEAQILDRLAPHASEVEIGESIHERMVLNASFLIERKRLNDFNVELDEVASHQEVPELLQH